MANKKQKISASFGKRTSRTAVLLLIVLALALVLSACGGSNSAKETEGVPTQSPSGTKSTDGGDATVEDGTTDEPAADDFTVIPTAASSLTLVEKDTEAFTMQIPEGWEIRYGWDGEKMLMIRVWDPNEPVDQIFFATDMVPFMKSEASAQAYGITGMTMFSEAPVLDPPTNETLFLQIPKLRTYYSETIQMKTAAEMIPEIYGFELLDTLPANSAFSDDSLDDSVIYGTFRTEDGAAEGEGIGFACIADVLGTMPDPMSGVDLAFYNVYNFTVITAAKDEFVNYEEILCRSFVSLKIKQEFVDLMLENSEKSFAALQEFNASISASYDSYNAAWSARSQSSDISRQKQSDATLGYERVYDTETGEIYKAYLGFTDDYPDSGYLPVSDEMYTQGWSGYIEK